MTRQESGSTAYHTAPDRPINSSHLTRGKHLCFPDSTSSVSFTVNGRLESALPTGLDLSDIFTAVRYLVHKTYLGSVVFAQDNRFAHNVFTLCHTR